LGLIPVFFVERGALRALRNRLGNLVKIGEVTIFTDIKILLDEDHLLPPGTIVMISPDAKKGRES
jgi:hypothetical protein